MLSGSLFFPMLLHQQQRADNQGCHIQAAPDAVTGFEWVSLRSPEQFAEINRRYRHALAGLKPGIKRRRSAYLLAIGKGLARVGPARSIKCEAAAVPRCPWSGSGAALPVERRDPLNIVRRALPDASGITSVPCTLPGHAGLFYGRLEPGMTPITKHERRAQNDQRGAIRYACRRLIDQKLRDMQLQKDLKEVWQ